MNIIRERNLLCEYKHPIQYTGGLCIFGEDTTVEYVGLYVCVSLVCHWRITCMRHRKPLQYFWVMNAITVLYCSSFFYNLYQEQSTDIISLHKKITNGYSHFKIYGVKMTYTYQLNQTQRRKE